MLETKNVGVQKLPFSYARRQDRRGVPFKRVYKVNWPVSFRQFLTKRLLRY